MRDGAHQAKRVGCAYHASGFVFVRWSILETWLPLFVAEPLLVVGPTRDDREGSKAREGSSRVRETSIPVR